MIHAYDRTYLAGAQRLLARMLDYMVNDLGNPIEITWQWFLASDMCARFEQGDCAVLAGMSGVELAYAILRQAGRTEPTGTPHQPYDRSLEYWIGWALAYYQWDSGMRFAEITQAVPIEDILLLYSPYHEMDIRQFVDRMDELYREAVPETNLKLRRMAAGMSQSELAERSEVPIRTIQQYEQRQKDINKAQVQTLLRLARVLTCDVEDLMEKVGVRDGHADKGKA